jgi:hypothetical protein
MKKFVIIGVLVFAFALSANVSFAQIPCGCGFSWCCPETVVNNSNNATVWNSVKTVSGSGYNAINGGWFGASSIATGKATSITEAQNQIGFNQTEILNPTAKTYVNNSNGATLMNGVKTISKTGGNAINGGGIGVKYIGSGEAYSGSSVVNLVGQSVTKIGCANCAINPSN